MRPVHASIVVSGPSVEVEQLWYDRTRWASWVSGFGHVAKLDDHWPQAGARLLWNSRPGGRGLVSETVTRYEAGGGQQLRVEDERLSGVQRIRFEAGGDVTRITVELEVEPKRRLAPLRRAWLRRELGDALRLTLRRFSYELEAERRIGPAR